MKNIPRISVVTPVYNSAAYLPEMIESVLSQTVPPLELLIADDGSTDGSADRAESYGSPVRCIRLPHRGSSAARNEGFRQALGDFVTSPDADDLLAPTALEAHYHCLEKQPKAEIVMGKLCLFRDEPLEMGAGSRRVFHEPMMALSLGGALIARPLFERIGYLNEELKLGEDNDWFYRAWENGVSAYVHEDLILYYRRHGANVTNDFSGKGAAYLRVVRESLLRRRNDQKMALPSMFIRTGLSKFPPAPANERTAKPQ